MNLTKPSLKTAMNETVVEEIKENPSELDCGTFTKEAFGKMETCGFYVEGIGLAVIGSFAILANIFTLYVFLRKEARNSFNLLIVALTCVDLVFCVALMSDYCFVRTFGLSTNIYTMMFPYFVYPLVNITLTASIYMTVILALERYVAIIHPLLHRNLSVKYSVKQRVVFYTLPVVIVSVFVNIPKFLETKVVATQKSEELQDRNDEYDLKRDSRENSSTSIMDGKQNQRVWQNVTTYSIDVTDLRDSEIYIKYYMNIFQTMMLGVVPFCALIFFNIKIYNRFMLTRGRFQRRNTRSTQAKDLHLSVMLVCVICVFFITNFPRLLLNLYEMFYCDEIIACGDRFFPPVWFICSTAVNHLLLVINCIMNFVVYCYFNRNFRETILYLGIKWGLCKEGENHDGNMNGDFQSDYKNGNTIVVLQSPNASHLPSPNSSAPCEHFEMTQRNPPNNNDSIAIIQQPIDVEKEHIINPRFSTNLTSRNVPRDTKYKKHSLIFTLCNRQNVVDMNVGKDFNSI